MPPLDAQTGYHHTPPDPQSCAPTSKCDDMPALINSTGSSPLASSSDHLPVVCKIALSPQYACQRCKQYSMIRSLRIVAVECFAQLELVCESIRRTPQFDRHLTFHNPLLELQCEYQYDPRADPRFFFDISLQPQVHTYKVFGYHHRIHTDRRVVHDYGLLDVIKVWEQKGKI